MKTKIDSAKTLDQLKNIKDKIPYLNTPDEPLVSTTQRLIPIADIEDDLVLFKDGGAALIMESSSLNFGLLSEKEQEAVIYAYAAFLNSLSFPIQLVIRSQRKDITSYMKYIDKKAKDIANPKLSYLIDSYKKFIDESIKKKNVLGKRFFIVIPFSPLEMGLSKTLGSLTKKRAGPLPFTQKDLIKKAKVALYPKRDHIMRQSGRIGIRPRQLNSDELIRLFYDIFNPTPPPKKEEKEI